MNDRNEDELDSDFEIIDGPGPSTQYHRNNHNNYNATDARAKVHGEIKRDPGQRGGRSGGYNEEEEEEDLEIIPREYALRKNLSMPEDRVFSGVEEVAGRGRSKMAATHEYERKRPGPSTSTSRSRRERGGEGKGNSGEVAHADLTSNGLASAGMKQYPAPPSVSISVAAGTSGGPSSLSKPMGFQKKQEINARRAQLSAERQSVQEQIKDLQSLLRENQLEESKLVAELRAIDNLTHSSSQRQNLTQNQSATSRRDAKTSTTIDYMSRGVFEWEGRLKADMKKVWGIDQFRLCQEGVCNANVDGRDILCIMPTGGGKSLTYQLPALIANGTTVVISPLISLITDQVLHLREAGVECMALTGATNKEVQRDAFRRMSKGEGKEIKLCYVTPEKVAKSKTFVSVLESMNSAGRLARIVIDEAHCCSQLGHDFRPDYKKLTVLKTLFPNVPILAVTATLSRKVLPDLLKILRLPPLTDGRAANDKGTVHFTSPLHRPNLFYRVLPKPSIAKAAIQAMANWIIAGHLNENGIVYCLSKKDTEVISDGLRECSGGKIKTGVYHADIGDAAKENIHQHWRKGNIHVVCATIAFGLGIDNPNTRFVLHHSLSKSVDGYYQESGRAGRDGRKAECVLFYRAQDASRISALTVDESDGQDKVHEMLRYAEDLQTCRKITFAKYFATTASTPTNAWDGDDDTLTACGHCDNCNRDKDTVEVIDTTFDSWRIVQTALEVTQHGGRVTISGLADLARGLAGGTYPIVSTGRKRGKHAGEDKGTIDLASLCGGKIALSKDNAETLVIRLVLDGYLQEEYHATSYTVNVYVKPGPKSIRLSRLSLEDMQTGSAPLTLNRVFPAPPVKIKKSKKGATSMEETAETAEGDDQAEIESDGESKASGTKRKRLSASSADTSVTKRAKPKPQPKEVICEAEVKMTRSRKSIRVPSIEPTPDIDTPSDINDSEIDAFMNGRRRDTTRRTGNGEVVEISDDEEGGWKSTFSD